jgi:hypothetical protein
MKIFMILFLLTQLMHAQTLFIENFDHPPGTPLTNLGWVAYSGTENQMVIADGNLIFDGYPASGKGNSTIIYGGPGFREDVYFAFAEQNTGAVYVFFLVNVASSTGGGNGDYFFALAPSFPEIHFRAKVFLKDTLGGVRFGISKGSSTDPVYALGVYPFGSTVLLAVKYEFINDAAGVDDAVKLFINPDLTMGEPAVPDAMEIDLTYSDKPIGSIALRQSGYDHTTRIDGIRVSGTWSGAVPVEFTLFNAKVNENSVELKWSTSSEENNKGFQIERNSGSSWQKLDFVQGKGYSANNNTYLYNDNNLLPGTYQYRLKQIDNDGNFKYSSVVEAHIEAPNVYELSQNYPNPFNPSTSIKFTLAEGGYVTLTIYNLLGQAIKVLVDEHMSKGVHTVHFDADDLKSGLYLYKIETDNFSQMRKMTLLR